MVRRRTLAAALAATLLCTVAVGSASAVTNDGSFVLRLSECTTVNWTGMPWTDWQMTQPAQSHGTARHCAYLYKGSESDPNADYWMLRQDITWTVTADESWPGYQASYDNPAVGVITSSAVASDWDGTETTVSHVGDCAQVNAGVSIPPFSFSTPVKLCGDNTALTRTSMTATGARWDTGNILRTPKWSSAYVQRVSPGVRPLMRGSFWYPKFTVFNTGTKRCQYYCFWVWGTSPVMKNHSIALQV